MRKSDIFVGNINRCVKRVLMSPIESGKTSFEYKVLESELYKENAILIRLSKNTYADLETVESYLDYVYLKTNHSNEELQRQGLVLATTPINCDSLFVESDTLKPYETLNVEKDRISVKRLKIEVKHSIDNLNK